MSEPKYVVGWVLPDQAKEVRYLRTLEEVRKVFNTILKKVPFTKLHDDKSTIQ